MLLYPKLKWPKFEEQRIDLYVLVKTATKTVRDTRKRENLWPQGFCKGWCTKKFFRDNHVISDGTREGEYTLDNFGNRKILIDVDTPYVRESQLQPMEDFPVPQDYRLPIMPKDRKRWRS